MSKLLDVNKWRGFFYGHMNYSFVEREKYWTYEDDVEFEIACVLKQLLESN